MKSNMEEVYKEHAKSVFRYLLSLSHDEDMAEELTQETFYRAVYSADKYDGSCKMSVWLCQIAKHVWYQELEKRKKNKTEELNEYIASAELSPEDKYFKDNDKLSLYRAINRLGGPMKEVVYLRLTGNFSFAEIGEILNKSETWARTAFYRAKQKIIEESNK
ncbi:MAG: sigma-70 family RNA polymerase sigma factor [Oscillospiraceae bacterium]|nr:sigma-70 family RNA polymerase sigma factor [Oscillospiraceae bacterium]